MATIFSQLSRPTLIVNTEITRRNINRMAEKAAAQGIVFRPHFKTHQSAQIGDFFRAAGVRSITVSSVDMASYFASQNWDDILIAFPVNVHQLAQINKLASRTHLGLLVESEEVVEKLSAEIHSPVDLWIKIDTGLHRTGIPSGDVEQVAGLIHKINAVPLFHFRGLLTHAGQTYRAVGKEQITQTYLRSVQELVILKDQLARRAISVEKISCGDTPGCTQSPDLGAVDEIRPGNFVFYDAQQLNIGACTFDQIAAAVACPVVSVHPDRSTVVLYGGAVHLSKDTFSQDGTVKYGLVALPNANGWSEPVAGAYVASLSQEHGVVVMPAETLRKIHPGDWLCIIPAHICLVVSMVNEYYALDGQVFHSMGLPALS